MVFDAVGHRANRSRATEYARRDARGSGGDRMGARVTAVSKSGTHTMRKPNHEVVKLLTGLGVEGDAHLGVHVKHRSRVKADPTQPNLRQVHLVHAELHDE